MSTIGLMPNRKRIELAGQPVLTPPKMKNNKDPSPVPDEKADTREYIHQITHLNSIGTWRPIKTRKSHSWRRVGNALQKSYNAVTGRFSKLRTFQGPGKMT